MSITISLFPAQEIPQSANRPEVKRLAVLLASGTDEQVFSDCLVSVQSYENWQIWVQCLEPGPQALSGGLRVLANEVVPRLSVPDRLVIALDANAQLPMEAQAYLRRLFQAKVPVVVVAKSWPGFLDDLALEPGQSLERVEPNALEDYLAAWLE